MTEGLGEACVDSPEIVGQEADSFHAHPVHPGITYTHRKGDPALGLPLGLRAYSTIDYKSVPQEGVCAVTSQVSW